MAHEIRAGLIEDFYNTLPNPLGMIGYTSPASFEELNDAEPGGQEAAPRPTKLCG